MLLGPPRLSPLADLRYGNGIEGVDDDDDDGEERPLGCRLARVIPLSPWYMGITRNTRPC